MNKKYQLKSIYRETLKHNLCISCGICEIVCPQSAISLIINTSGDSEPTIDFTKCIHCGVCADFCPNTKMKLLTEAKKITSDENPNNFGLQNANYFLTYYNNPQRIKSSSGGFVTGFLCLLLKKKLIDGVIHGEMVLNSHGKPHYQATFSSTIQNIEKNSSSFYSAFPFNEIVNKNCRNQQKNFVFVGTPCVIRGYRQLILSKKEYQKNKFYFFALVCGHNCSNQLVDYIAEDLSISREQKFKCNLRFKNDISDANQYKNCFFSNTETIAISNRYNSIYTKAWRNYFFAKNCCHYCADFWGYQADISIKDAWGKWAWDPSGYSIVIFRNEKLLQLFLNSESIFYKERLALDEIANCQLETSNYKQVKIMDRFKHYSFHWKNIQNGFTVRYFFSKISSFFYNAFGFKISKKILLTILAFFQVTKICFKHIKYLIRILVKLSKILFFPFVMILNYKKYTSRNNMKKILVLGGYGYKNLGDEAQLNESLKILKTEFPDYIIKVLTPNQNYTSLTHQCSVDEAPRIAFFNEDKSTLYSLNSKWKRFRFFLISVSIIINCKMSRCGIMPFFINDRKISLIYNIKTSAAIYFCGGGYLTGKTLSRLWDSLLIMEIASVFKIPVILSGQTIGVWISGINKKLAKCGLSKADLIGLRDPDQSKQAIQELQIKKPKIIVTHDDALFCEKFQNQKQLEEILFLSGVEKKDTNNGYIVMQIHYWGLTESKNKIDLLNKLKTIAELAVRIFNKKILLISMTPSDSNTIKDFIRFTNNPSLIPIQETNDFRVIRSIISSSDICISMKHHPIIFAFGESVPVLSMSLSEYYSHKNIGALKLFNLERYNINLNQADCEKKGCLLLEDIKEKSLQIREQIKNSFQQLQQSKHQFINEMKSIIIK